MTRHIRIWIACLMLPASALAFATAACGTGTEVQAFCEADADCFEGATCDLEDTQLCLRSCTTEENCLTGQECKIPTGATSGVCRQTEDP